ncbi:MAG: guanylate kinase [Lachnospiraceae bacterium]|nr:guanylate kinase [Lachnospiraceae bacterium]
MKRKGILTVISGFSGAGKGTVMKHLLEKYPEEYALSISCTSRSPRTGEQDGREYFFKTNEEFEQMIAEDAFLEHAKYVDHYYGTPAAYVKEQMDAGRNVILEIELQGALQIRNKLPETILMFLMPPSADELENRLRGRGTETDEVIRARLRRAVEESRSMDQYDYLVVNDDLETCVEEVHHLIQSQRMRTSECMDLITDMQEGVKKFL